MGLLGAPTYPMLRDATQATLFEVLDSNGIPYEHNKAENTLVMKDTGSRILFRPVDEFERLRGTNLAWFGVDELTYTQEDAWLRLEGRLRDPKATRLCGFAVWTPKGYDWVYRKFIADPVKGYEAMLAQAVREPAPAGEDSGFLRAAEGQLRREVLPAGSAGRVPEHGRARGCTRRSTGRCTCGTLKVDPQRSRCCGRWISTWTR